MSVSRFLFVAALPLAFVAGCGGSGTKEDMAAVSGVITYNGQPLANAEVHFMNGQLGGYGQTDEQGRFKLIKGAPVGLNKVYITKGDANNPNAAANSGGDDSALDAGQFAEMAKHKSRKKRKKPFLPPKFSDPEKTTLTFEVPPSGSDAANFKL